MKNINIVLAADNNYAQHACVAIVSILKNTLYRKDVNFFILSDSINDINKDKIKTTVVNFGARINFINIYDDMFDHVYISGHISKAAYFRLLIDEFLPLEVTKVIYLDVDLLVCKDIIKLWNYDMKTMPIAAVNDYGIISSSRLCKQKEQVIGLQVGKPYFNSGVLVLDLQQWREKKYGKMVVDLIRKQKFPHHDQDVLNKIFMDKWVELPLEWNVIPPVFNLFMKVLLNNKLREKAVNARCDPAILHFAGRYKPWEFVKTVGFNDKYYEYLSLSEFANVEMPQPSNNMDGKSIFRQQIRFKLASLWSRILQ